MGKHYETISWLGGYLYIIILCVWILIVYPFGVLFLLPYGWPVIWAWLVAGPLFAYVLNEMKNRPHERGFDGMLATKRMEDAEATFVNAALKVRNRQELDEYLEKVKRKRLADYIEETKREKDEK